MHRLDISSQSLDQDVRLPVELRLAQRGGLSKSVLRHLARWDKRNELQLGQLSGDQVVGGGGGNYRYQAFSKSDGALQLGYAVRRRHRRGRNDKKDRLGFQYRLFDLGPPRR